MKKNVLFAFVLAALLALPAVGLAQTEFTLGGYLKLEAYWDSAALPKNINTPPRRNNDPNATHGRFNATAQSSRFNFTIKGPTLWGAKVTGFMEVDFDEQGDQRQSASNSYRPRLRHAFFRLNWPETELLFGQYWGYFSEFYPELIQDGPFQGHGVATQRLAQVRVTQTFGLGQGKMTLSALVGKPTDTNDSGNVPYPPSAATGPLEGQTSETPQIQAKIQWEGDLWGKAGFYGAPRGFVAQVAGAWQRSRYRAGDFSVVAVNGGSTFATGIIRQPNQQYLNNWVVQGTLFIPVIPTTTKSLAGTSALTVQAYVGEGLDFIGNATGVNSQFRFQGIDAAGNLLFDRRLTKTWGGYVQANYYFTNQWFMNVAAGLGCNYDINRLGGSNPDAFLVDPVHTWWEVSADLYYRPITALKFGLQYTYTRADYYQTIGTTNMGEAHSVRFGSWFFF
jgi:hypothetical protein